MKENIFKLSTVQLKEIALDLQQKVEKGLNHEKTEIQCIPTYIKPKTLGVEGQATVLDLGGTNYRASVVSFNEGAIDIYPEDGWSKDLSIMKTKGFTEKDLFEQQASFLKDLKIPAKSPIGYCFSYPAECLPDGDAKLLRWTKGVDIPEMLDQPIGKPLKEFLNEQGPVEFTAVKVINDTVASLFAGLSDSSYDAYIGLIVGTGTNMATFIHSDRIGKLDKSLNWQGLTPITWSQETTVRCILQLSTTRSMLPQVRRVLNVLKKPFQVCTSEKYSPLSSPEMVSMNHSMPNP